MPLPRYRDVDGDYQIVLFCRKCGWAIAKDRITMAWKECRSCSGQLETNRVDYGKNPYKPVGYD
ncbi:hypothetical protein ES703_12193 [subsurface metagenome]